MTVTELIAELQRLIAEDPTIADLDTRVWVESQESYESTEEDQDDVTMYAGAVMSIVVPLSIDDNGEEIGSHVAIRAVFI